MSTVIILLTLSGMLGSTCGWAQNTRYKRLPKSDNNLELGRSMLIFNNVLTGVNNLYVDTLDINGMTTNGINAMLSNLDPYTVYMPESEGEDFKFMTTGEYAGIGAYIQALDSAVYVDTPMPGTPAMKMGLQMGDKFISIDGKSVIPGTAQSVSNLLRGPVGTDVTVVIRRLGEDKDRTIILNRQKVIIDQVVHKGMYADSIGYIRLASFTDKSADDVRRAYEDLNKNHKMKGLILDLRSNGGGVLDDAIKILSMFIPPKTMVLYTKGKLPETSQQYYTSGKPICEDLPVVVLINGGSASASEIVSGTLQDMDRAVLVGSKSFGKGLVQTTRPLPYNGVLKVTIARYYIPSGRCIQQLDYSHRNPDGSVGAVPDSLTHVFKTKGGRLVRDGGGIRPDVTVEDEMMSPLVFNIIREGYLFGYSNKLYLKYNTPTKMQDVQISDDDYNGLVQYLSDSNLKYGTLSLQTLDKLRELADFEGYKAVSKKAFDELAKVLKPDLHRDIAPHKDQIKRLLRGLLASHYYGQAGQYAVGLQSDPTFTKALEIITDKAQYHKILSNSNDNHLSKITKATK